jgi:porphobilinogen synthase
MRRMVRETRLDAEDLILPLFVCHGSGVRLPIEAMPGVERLSVDLLIEECKEVRALGIPGVILFGIPDRKDAVGSEAYATDGIIPRAITAVKSAVPDLSVWADVCLCEYTDHGHCGVLRGDTVDNDATLPLLARAAGAYARAGADVIAPSDMMDGRVEAIRETLDEADCSDTVICSYAAKYASAYYGPFREAAGSTPQFGDRQGYQMDPANVREALHEVALDLDEGADIVMVKPALAYLDVIRAVREEFDAPIAAYNVSGEYAMVCAAAERGWIDRKRIVLETLTSMRRAGADLILTYHAKEAARWLR